MNCPHCQKEIPASHKSNWCPSCGRDFKQSEDGEDNWVDTLKMIAIIGIVVLGGTAVLFRLLHVGCGCLTPVT